MKIFDKKDYSISLKGHNPASGWNKGIKHSLETRAKMSETHRAKRAQGWRKNFTYGKESRKKFRKARKSIIEQGRDWTQVKYLYHTDDGLMRIRDAMKFYAVSNRTVRNRCAKQGYISYKRILYPTVRWKNWRRVKFQNTPRQLTQLRQAYRRCFGRDLPYIDSQKNTV